MVNVVAPTPSVGNNNVIIFANNFYAFSKFRKYTDFRYMPVQQLFRKQYRNSGIKITT